MKDTQAHVPRHHTAPAAATSHTPRRHGRTERGPAPHSPWGDLPPLPPQADPTDLYTPRRREQMLDDLIRAGLGEEQALAQLARLEAGDLWSG
ncbi:hypothetical protein SA2016_0021 [Sinomonas atrocyanea]|uniref:Uncharacterized protein n=1 Tax=Sinomonas atrocyanea TaxID=37927 RepID=A0A126ZUY5_9MICC|nr:hypothetical protein [Sinomonas atrocyanea]AMM30726.1 hypothetical protein SA2016_0021 [Sinomonas atrocyanea]GEB63770.1 hypothetical protein SAT01_12180 [Sinomonas atrocyanea]GGG74459.1 hypothetical protein GCM10007172_28990 [Sinomonas atrocyanea]